MKLSLFCGDRGESRSPFSIFSSVRIYLASLQAASESSAEQNGYGSDSTSGSSIFACTAMHVGRSILAWLDVAFQLLCPDLLDDPSQRLSLKIMEGPYTVASCHSASTRVNLQNYQPSLARRQMKGEAALHQSVSMWRSGLQAFCTRPGRPCGPPSGPIHPSDNLRAGSAPTVSSNKWCAHCQWSPSGGDASSSQLCIYLCR